MLFERVVIIGVGLIGASLGLALKRRNHVREIIGVDRLLPYLTEALALGAIDRIVTDSDRTLLAEPIDADIAVFAVPPDSLATIIHAWIPLLSPRTLLTDTASVKADVVGRMSRSLPSGHLFIGSHPMAGSDRSGPSAARADLFDNRVSFITPSPDHPAEAIDRLTRFWQAVGSQVIRTTPEEHDERVARTSHLPHLVAAAVALCLREGDEPAVGPGFRDFTRLARGNSQLWAAILAGNQHAVLTALDELRDQLDRLRTLLANATPQSFTPLAEGLEHAKRSREALDADH